MALLLERHEVEGLLDMNGAIEATEAAFREFCPTPRSGLFWKTGL